MTELRVGFVINADRVDAVDTAARAAKVLAEADVAVHVVEVPILGEIEASQRVSLERVAPVVAERGFAASCDLVLSLGGDGTFLRAAHLCRDAEVPLMGVNLGHLGFLAEVEPAGLDEALAIIVDRRWTIECRTTLDMRIEDQGGTTLHRDWSLNEVSVEKLLRQRLVRMDVRIGEEWFANVSADGLLVATSTGSTAYALSAGGPIVSPRVAATLVVPVAPHSLFDRTVVASPDEPVIIDLHADGPAALVSCDGRSPVTLDAGQRVIVSGSPYDVLMARVRPTAFYELVRRKFHLR